MRTCGYALTFVAESAFGQHEAEFVISFRRMKGALVVNVSDQGRRMRLAKIP